MAEPSEYRLEHLVERLRLNDDEARHALLGCAHERLRRLAVRLHQDIPSLRGRHDADSVLHTAWPRLLKALESTSPPTAADFFRLAAHKIRQTLLDLTNQQRTRDRRERAEGAVDALPPDVLSWLRTATTRAGWPYSPRSTGSPKSCRPRSGPSSRCTITSTCPRSRSPSCWARPRDRSATSGSPPPVE